jgi:membrane protease YdiL (CAAX protease family)
MPTTVEWIYVALFAACWPLYEHWIAWPLFMRQLRDAPEHARLSQYRATTILEWVLAGAGLVLWARSGRAWSQVGLTAPEGWRLWLTVVLVLAISTINARNMAVVVRSAKARARLGRRLSSVEAIVPRTARELDRFVLLSLTAGFCEEFLFRGFLLWALAPWLTWWGAVAVSTVVFALGHSYQGWGGMTRVAAVGLVMACIYGATHSLVAPIVLHALIDMGSGLMTWAALRPDEPSDAPPVEAAATDATAMA